MVTDPPTHPPTHRQDRLQYTVPQLACSVTKSQAQKRRTVNGPLVDIWTACLQSWTESRHSKDTQNNMFITTIIINCYHALAIWPCYAATPRLLAKCAIYPSCLCVLHNSYKSRLTTYNGTFSTNRLYRAIGVWNISHRAGRQDKHIIQLNNTINQDNHKHSSAWAFWRWSSHHSQASSEESF